MSDNGRLSLIFLCNILLYFAIGEFNDLAGFWSVSLHVDALLLIFFGLYLNRMFGLLFTAVLGFLAESLHPVPSGTYLVSYLAMWLFFVACQRRIRRQNPFHIRFVAILAQSVWILLMALFLGDHLRSHWSYWQRILVDLMASSLILALFSWSWCKFQLRLLYSLGWDLEAQMSDM